MNMPTIKIAKNTTEGLIAFAVIFLCLGGELGVLFHGLPPGVDQVLSGRILGTMDAASLIVLNFYYGNTRASMQQVDAITAIGQAAAATPISIRNTGVAKETTVSAEAARVSSAALPNQSSQKQDNPYFGVRDANFKS